VRPHLALAALTLVAATAHAEAPKVRRLAVLPAGVTVKGDFEAGLAFHDRAGDNLIIFSTKQTKRSHGDWEARSRSLYATHLVAKGSGWRVERAVRDMEEDCGSPNGGDLTAAFVPEALEVTDLDGDGTAEVTFAYRLGCRTDVRPLTMKLLVLEDGQKYILRGQARVVLTAHDDETYGTGDFEVDPAFAKAPAVFLKHAKEAWAAVRDERM